MSDEKAAQARRKPIVVFVFEQKKNIAGARKK